MVKLRFERDKPRESGEGTVLVMEEVELEVHPTEGLDIFKFQVGVGLKAPLVIVCADIDWSVAVPSRPASPIGVLRVRAVGLGTIRGVWIDPLRGLGCRWSSLGALQTGVARWRLCRVGYRGPSVGEREVVLSG